MSATFIQIPARTIITLLTTAKFTEIELKGVYERVFALQHHGYNDVQIRVYTSIDKRTGQVRGDSEDRIMVCAFGPGKATGHDRKAAKRNFLFSATGVNRCSSEPDHDKAVKAIMDRLLGRMRDVYKRVNKLERCKCGGARREGKCKSNKNGNAGRTYSVCVRCDDFRWTSDKAGKPAPAPKASEVDREAEMRAQEEAHQAELKWKRERAKAAAEQDRRDEESKARVKALLEGCSLTELRQALASKSAA